MAVAAFDCGNEALDRWLRERAARNQDEGAARTFALCQGQTVVGYYALAAGAVDHAGATGKVRRNMPDPVPVVILARLAVDRRWGGQGLGSALLADAVRRAAQAAETIGIRAMLIHAIDERAAQFYERHGFRRSPIAPLTLMATMREIAAALGQPERLS